MKNFIFLLGFFLLMTVWSSCGSNKVKRDIKNVSVHKVNDSFFLTNEGGLQIKQVDCTLSNGAKTTCLEIITRGVPSEHDTGPWCPETTSDPDAKGGLWFGEGEMHSVSGDFIHNLAVFYNDKHWLLYDEDGHVIKTNSKEDCEKLAGAKLQDEFINYCIECLPEYVTDLSQTFVIPMQPQMLEEPISLGGPGRGGPGRSGPPPGVGERPSGPPPSGGPPGGGGGPSPRGLAFNGVPFDAPAPIELILSGYTIPPLDHAGGHINMDAGYHYHAHTGLTKEIKQKDGHAPMIGYAMDGIALYAYKDATGKEPSELDQCRGHYDEVRGYHYHVDAAGNNNFINCFSGAIVEK